MIIQSISDIITNSSSEVFCTITSAEWLNEIYEVLSTVIKTDEFYSEDYVGICNDEDCIQITMPYHFYESSEFYKAGIEAVLDKRFGNEYEIKYEN